MSQRIVILGGGESGVGTALLAKKEGFEVFVSDVGKIIDRYKQVLLHNEIEWEDEKHSDSLILNADLVMKSPGIPETVSVVKKLKQKNIPILSEIEFASRFTNATLIGITGSNGKTSTATLMHFILQNDGLDVSLGGNVGKSFASLIAEGNASYYVLELSSFQLDGIKTFRPHIAVLTNITPDHLDRYDNNFEAYVESKFRIAKNQTNTDFFIYDADDEVITNWLEKNPIQSQLIPFSLTKKFEKGAYIENEEITIIIDNTKITMPISTLGLQGQHNVKNAMAATTVATLLKIRKETIRESLENFQGVEHRLEKVLRINKVMYINDSKATNVNATFYALDSMKTPTVWIVGGVDKGNNYEDLLPLVNEKVKAIVCLGADNDKIIDTFGNIVDLLVETASIQDAVQVSYRIAERGDTVLLSPACASFDLFKNFEERGRQFKAAVRNL